MERGEFRQLRLSLSRPGAETPLPPEVEGQCRELLTRLLIEVLEAQHLTEDGEDVHE
jgi:hypothetical protein